MNNLLITIAIVTLMFCLGYLYGRISEKQTKYKKDERREK
jgi:hypothetical protein